MALIQCKECGKEISSAAEACPHCGAKTSFGEKSKAAQSVANQVKIYVLVGIIGVGLFAVNLITMFGDLANSWYYNYAAPLSSHETSVLLGMCIGIGMFAGAMAGLNITKKRLEREEREKQEEQE